MRKDKAQSFEFPLFDSIDGFIKYYGEQEAVRIMSEWYAKEKERREEEKDKQKG